MGEPAPDNIQSAFEFDSIYSVELDCFSGPMDLLLHLSIRQEVDISLVSMSRVVEQYLAIVERYRADNLDLDEIAEYLVIAAELISLKSRLLLPKVEQEEETSEAPQDLEELRERLRLYALCKKQVEEISRLPQFDVDFFGRRVTLDKREARGQDELEETPSFALGVLFSKMLKRIGGDLGRLKISLEPASVVKFMMKTVDILRLKRKQNFYQLVANVSDVGALTGSITMFFGALELAKRGVVSLSQENQSAPIFLKYVLDSDKVVDLDEYREVA